MNTQIYISCIDYASTYGCSFLDAFVKLYEGSDMPDEEYEALFDEIEANQSDYLYW